MIRRIVNILAAVILVLGLALLGLAVYQAFTTQPEPGASAKAPPKPMAKPAVPGAPAAPKLPAPQ